MSSLHTLLLGQLAILLLATGSAFLVTLLVQSSSGPVAEAFRGYASAIDWDLRFLRKSMTSVHVIALQGVVTALLVIIAIRGFWLPLTLVPFVLVMPRSLLARARLNRITEMDQQIDSWLLVLANALRANPSIGEALETSARLVPAPFCHEIDLMLNEYHLGAPIDTALKTLAQRLKSRTINVALGSLRIARNTGGNLPETLEISAAALREIARLEGVVRSKTAEGKAQASVIAVTPFPMVGLINHINPDLLSPLWSSMKGYALIGVAFLLWLSAIMWARKILQVDI